MPSPKETLHYQHVTPNNIHPCDKCKGLEAQFQQEKNYFCKDCFKTGMINASKEGCVFVEDLAENLDG